MIRSGETPAAMCDVIWGLIRAARPEIVVEAGTGYGNAARMIASGLALNGSGHLFTADPEPLWRDCDKFPEVTCYHGDFLDMLDAVPDPDFAYIDASGPGDDGAKLRWLHFQAVRERLNPGGIICVHDTASDNWGDGEGGISAERIREACQINLPHYLGLSIYREE